jgi:hypothetical protein
MDSPRPSRLPAPVDPAAPPRAILRAAALTVAGGLLLLFLGALAAQRASERGVEPVVAPSAFLAAWLVSLPLGAVLLAAYGLAGRRRLRRYERRAGFLPRTGRKDRPAGGRTTLFRVEYGSKADALCMMVARWDHSGSEGWHRGRVVEHAWVPADDPVALGEQRARLTALAEELEERLDDVRLDADGQRRLTDELLAERRAEAERSRGVAEALARAAR